MKTTTARLTSVFALMAFCLPAASSAIANASSRVPLCQDLTEEWQIRACEEDVRGTEYALRNWLPQAIEKATLAHILDFTNPLYIGHLGDYQDRLQNLLKVYSFTQASTQFPELNLTDVNDQANRNLALIRGRNLAKNALGFASLASALMNAPDWHTRIIVGRAEVGSIRGQRNAQLSQFMDFVINDLFLARSYNLAGGAPALRCSLLYPFQFSYSQASLMALMLAVGSFPGSSPCIIEGYRAILIQALGVAGGGLVDSNYNTIAFEAGPAGGPSLSDPLPVLQEVIADPKLTQAYVRSVYSLINSRGQSTITADFLDQIIAGTNTFLDQVGVPVENRITFYRGISAFASTRSDIVSLRLGVRVADELAVLARRRRSK